ncbi:zinc finger CCCH domain-containing protein 59 isoform X2 [Amborella trichopoda]|nr:zinc finger CCCH domain-containing protein 59 isoform X2 [Amborella trichopoda]|eukprot:XP_006853826.2 zinc finger CCCH domain-containing protein 59 isoform X2 [Amborella trichopoda]
MAPPRILLCGDVLGRFNIVFKRVTSVSKSNGPFDALFCVGQFFPNNAEEVDEMMRYIRGDEPVPIPTYFIGDYGAGALKLLSSAGSQYGFKTDGIKICENLFWLKGSGRFNLHGLSVVYLSGRRSSNDQLIGAFNGDDIDALRALAEEPGIFDLFLTNEWPQGISNRAYTSNPRPEILDPSGSDVVISELAAELKPRYHIAGAKGIFYAREPYSNNDAVHVTRFLGLACVGNSTKQKFIHAISPTPACSMSATDIALKPLDTTPSPYLIVKDVHMNESTKQTGLSLDVQYWRYDTSRKRQRDQSEDGGRLCFSFISTGSCSRAEKCQFVHDDAFREKYLKGACFDFINRGKCERGSGCKFRHSLSFEDDGSGINLNRPNDNTGVASSEGSTGRRKHCWFCLSSPNIESHLILSVGETCYCTLAKGPLVLDHVLIVPTEHFPSTLSLPSSSVIEMQKYKNSLKAYFKSQKKATVIYEWVFNHSKSIHANLQVVPVPLSKASYLRGHFISAARKSGFEFEVIRPDDHGNDAWKDLKRSFDEKFSFFYVELPEGTILAHSVEDEKGISPHFGREVLASLLDQMDRVDWRKCKDSKEDEIRMVEEFKKKFESFDPM